MTLRLAANFILVCVGVGTILASSEYRSKGIGIIMLILGCANLAASGV